jgi:hypothetical protein
MFGFCSVHCAVGEMVNETDRNNPTNNRRTKYTLADKEFINLSFMVLIVDIRQIKKTGYLLCYRYVRNWPCPAVQQTALNDSSLSKISNHHYFLANALSIF